MKSKRKLIIFSITERWIILIKIKSNCFILNDFLFVATKKENELGPLAHFGRILVGFLKPFASRHVRYSRSNSKWNNLDQDATSNYPALPRNYNTIEDNTPPPEIQYNFISRTRQDYSCDGELKYLCDEAVEDNRFYYCNISRSRYI